MWVYLSKYESSRGEASWMDPIVQNKEYGFNEYIFAYYFTTVTMATVGYGDFSPIS
jgi:hypothetical protein